MMCFHLNRAAIHYAQCVMRPSWIHSRGLGEGGVWHKASVSGGGGGYWVFEIREGGSRLFRATLLYPIPPLTE